MTGGKTGRAMLISGAMVIAALMLALVVKPGGDLSEKQQTVAYGCGYLVHQVYARRGPADDLPEWCVTIKEMAKKNGFDLP